MPESFPWKSDKDQREAWYSEVFTSVIYLNLARKQITVMQMFKHSSNYGNLFAYISAGPSEASA